MEAKPNRLISEKSPYLLQHAYNPVDWYPWTKEAFQKARTENRPIFLSIGYSTCHWCHVMAGESFGDAEVAGLINDTFIAIKVDREERPDIDRVYMNVCQRMTGMGGWPLTVMMTAEKEPFFAATYIPRKSWFGRIGMLELIPYIKKMWSTRKTVLLSQATHVVASLQSTGDYSEGDIVNEGILDTAYRQISGNFDGLNGGFGSAPKFPMPHNIFFLLRYWNRKDRSNALDMVEKTLSSMRRGGIYDHIGHGFHRYSTDSKWLVPHFEKMLYDQALLAMAYIEAYQVTRQEDYTNTAREIFDYVLRDMSAKEGGFYSAEDADSEGVEGRYYLWGIGELRDILTEGEIDDAIRIFGLSAEGNFTEPSSGGKTGMNVLYNPKSGVELAGEMNISREELRSKKERIRKKLYRYRNRRIRPRRDDKIMTDWNGLMIAALAKGARVLDERRYALSAMRTANFILKKLLTSRGRLLHRYREGEAGISAFLDDYAFLIWGLLELYETTFNVRYLEKAISLNETLLRYYWDEESGGLYLTAHDGESILIRSKEVYDGAIPSGNSISMLNLLRLGYITARNEYVDKAHSIANAFSESVAAYPSSYTQLMTSIDYALGPAYQVIVCGNENAKDTEYMLDKIRRVFLPNSVAIFYPAGTKSPAIERIIPFIKDYSIINDRSTAYVCTDYRCQRPTNDVECMLRLLGK